LGGLKSLLVVLISSTDSVFLVAGAIDCISWICLLSLSISASQLDTSLSNSVKYWQLVHHNRFTRSFPSSTCVSKAVTVVFRASISALTLVALCHQQILNGCYHHRLSRVILHLQCPLGCGNKHLNIRWLAPQFSQFT